MARKKKRKQKSPAFSIEALIGNDIARAVWGVFLVAIAFFLILAAFEFAGAFGGYIYEHLSNLLGVGYVLLPLSVILLAVVLFRTLEEPPSVLKIIGTVVFFIATLALVEIAMPTHGGVVGAAIAEPLIAAVDIAAAVIFLLAFIAASLLVSLDVHPASIIASIRERMEHAYRDTDDEFAVATLDDADEEEDEYEDGAYDEEPDEDGAYDDEDEAEDADEPEEETVRTWEEGAESSRDGDIPIMAASGGAYTPPPLSLLSKNKGKPGVGDVKANANIIKRTLQNFGISVEMDEVSIGPTVTRYAMKPAEGVRLAKIVALQSNLELALAASPVRIEAPIPGKALVGIEVPNTARTTLGLGPLLGDPGFAQSDKSLLLSLGRTITGVGHFTDLSRMPHMLIAGATGSGKSVTIHSIIVSLLYRCGPDQLRFVMVDPKRVELTLYNSTPHLLTPVITDAKKAILSLKWLAKEMDRRYDVLEAEKVRDISSYHANVFKPAVENGTPAEELPEPMPYIVLIIDELADIMQTYPRELEAGIVRLAQMSRAVGIHLILSTQRPSVKVITGLIKANIPARIALQVASQVDSRTILDMGGAEKLLGAGDMLFLSSEMSQSQRLQAPFISEDEVKKVVKFIAKQADEFESPDLDFSDEKMGSGGASLFSGSDDDGEEDDELYDEARKIVIEAGRASTSYIQRKLRVGYARAARLMDLLEERGVVGPAEGSRPREVLESAHGGSGDEDDNSDDTYDDEDEER